MHVENLKKINDNSPDQRQRNSSLLSRSGVSVISHNRNPFNDASNPYFPHRIRDANDKSVSNRFTGNRSWNFTPNAEINLPDPQN